MIGQDICQEPEDLASISSTRPFSKILGKCLARSLYNPTVHNIMQPQYVCPLLGVLQLKLLQNAKQRTNVWCETDAATFLHDLRYYNICQICTYRTRTIYYAPRILYKASKRFRGFEARYTVVGAENMQVPIIETQHSIN